MQSLGHPSSLPTLHHFPIKNRFIDIAANGETDYELFGTFLQDEDGNTVKIIERSERGDPQLRSFDNGYKEMENCQLTGKPSYSA